MNFEALDSIAHGILFLARVEGREVVMLSGKPAR